MPQFHSRAIYEQQLAAALASVGATVAAETQAAIGNPPTEDGLDNAFWEHVAELYVAAITGVFVNAVGAYVDQRQHAVGGAINLASSSVDIDWTAIHSSAADWARQYTYDLVGGIDDTSRAALQDSLASYFDGLLTEDELNAKIADLFGPSRAATIAQTEITRAATEGEKQFEGELNGKGIKTRAAWETWGDACEAICQPLQGKERGDGWEDGPPYDSHPLCDCSVVVEPVEE